jgi:hypothetical protein
VSLNVRITRLRKLSSYEVPAAYDIIPARDYALIRSGRQPRGSQGVNLGHETLHDMPLPRCNH